MFFLGLQKNKFPVLDWVTKALRFLLVAQLAFIAVGVLVNTVLRFMASLIYLPSEWVMVIVFGTPLIIGLVLIVITICKFRPTSGANLYVVTLAHAAVFFAASIVFGEMLHVLSDQSDMVSLSDHLRDIIWKLSAWVYTGLQAFEFWHWGFSSPLKDLETVRLILKGWVEGWTIISWRVNLVVWLFVSYLIAHICYMWQLLFGLIDDLLKTRPVLGAKSSAVSYPQTRRKIITIIWANLPTIVGYLVVVLAFYLWLSVPPITPISPYGPSSVAVGMLQNLYQLFLPLEVLARNPILSGLLGLLSWLVIVVIYAFPVIDEVSRTLERFFQFRAKQNVVLSVTIVLVGVTLLLTILNIACITGLWLFDIYTGFKVAEPTHMGTLANTLVLFSPDEGTRSWTEWLTGSKAGSSAPSIPASPRSPAEGLQQISWDLHHVSHQQLSACSQDLKDLANDPDLLAKSPTGRTAARLRRLSLDLENAVTFCQVVNTTNDTALASLSASQPSPTVTAVVAENLSKPVGEALGEVIKHKTGTK